MCSNFVNECAKAKYVVSLNDQLSNNDFSRSRIKVRSTYKSYWIVVSKHKKQGGLQASDSY